jgi:subtilisin-like proprotein convertase family protein
MAKPQKSKILKLMNKLIKGFLLLLFVLPSVLAEAQSCLITSGTVDKRVISSADDAEQVESTGTTIINSTALELLYIGSQQQIGLRYQAVVIPKGALITSAYLEFTASVTSATAVNLNIYGEANDNTVAYVAAVGNNNISARPRTFANTAWTLGAWTSGTAYQSPSITSVVQEIINRDNWASNNAMAFILDNVSSTNIRTALSFDGTATTTLRPRLVINWTQNAALTTKIAISDCFDSNGNLAGGTAQAQVRAIVDWQNAPAGQTINVTCTGATTQNINPATSAKPAVLFFTVPANGAAVTVTSTYSTATACPVSKVITAPINCLLTPCCPLVLNTKATISNTTTGTLAFQTNCATTLNRTFVVAGQTGTLFDVNLGLTLTHAQRGDLQVRLISPTGTSVIVVGQSADTWNNYDLLLDDQTTNPLDAGYDQITTAPNYAADRLAQPTNPMSAFNGENPNGTWTIQICNTNFTVSGGQTLSFNGASLEVQTQDATACTTKTGGYVWRDFNNDGVKSATETEGLAGITVKAYNVAGTLLETVTTDYLGQYTFASVAPTVAAPVRVEFSTVPIPYNPSSAGTNSNTDVRFLTAAGCANNFSVNNTTEYCQNNPTLLLNCYVFSGYSSTTGTNKTIVSVPYNYTNDVDGNINGTTTMGAVNFDPPIYTPARPLPTGVADHSETGSTFGLAYDRTRRNLFASAYLKAGTGFGPTTESTGMIYKIADPFGVQTVTPYVDLNVVFGAGTAGANPHPIATTPDFFGVADNASNQFVGKVSLGDMVISNDQAFLYVVNLFDRKLYKIPTTGALNATTITSFAIPTTGLPVEMDAFGTAGTCPTSDVRPFGLGVHPDGSIFVGGVCSAESVSPGPEVVWNQASFQMTAYVWKFDGSVFNLVLNDGLRFDRNWSGSYRTFDDYFSATPSLDEDWEPWCNTSATNVYTSGQLSQNQAMVSDITFDEKGAMYIGMRDRIADCVSESYGYESSGDLYKASPSGTGYAMEARANSGLITTYGSNDSQGQAGGEFFYEDIQGDYLLNSGMGGVYYQMGKYEVLQTATDAVYLDTKNTQFFNPGAGGIQVHSTLNGGIEGAYDLYENGAVNLFAKASGLGVIRASCDEQPLEIGSFVWIDKDRDGVQDPLETPLGGVVVRLYKGTTLIAETITDANGRYLFSNKSKLGAGWIATGLDTALLATTMYNIVFGKAAADQYSATNKLTIATKPYVLTAINSTTASGNDQNDSEGAEINTTGIGIYPTIPVTTGARGANHTYDAGFYPCPTITNPSASQTMCAGATGSNITVNTNINTANGIRFVRFTSDQIAGATPTAAELALIYAGTAIGSAVTPTGASDPFTATYTWNTTDFPNTGATNLTYFVYAILNPDEGAWCRPTQEIQITIKPLPVLIDPADQAICVGNSTSAVNFASTVTGTTYAWTNTNTSIGLAGSGSTNIAEFTPINASAAPVVATINVTPTANLCAGAAQSFTITSNPQPNIADVTKTCPMGGGPAVSSHDFAKAGTWTISSQPSGASASVNATGLVSNMTIPGNYVVQLTTFGCSDLATITIPLCCPLPTCVAVKLTRF